MEAGLGPHGFKRAGDSCFIAHAFLACSKMHCLVLEIAALIMLHGLRAAAQRLERAASGGARTSSPPAGTSPSRTCSWGRCWARAPMAGKQCTLVLVMCASVLELRTQWTFCTVTLRISTFHHNPSFCAGCTAPCGTAFPSPSR